jgi:ElaB/YqjD/DUF883 family membrane-anchored ribosome-binding protein
MATQQQSGPGGPVEATQQKGKELASQAQQQMEERWQELRGGAEARLREQVDQRSTQAGEQAQAVGQAMKQTSEQLRSEGRETPARAVEQAAQKVEDFGGYLRSADADRILQDVERFARRRPWLTAATGAALGFVASRFLKASSERRYEGNGHAGSFSRHELPAGAAS